jgi:hypothetical protein
MHTAFDSLFCVSRVGDLVSLVLGHVVCTICPSGFTSKNFEDNSPTDTSYPVAAGVGEEGTGGTKHNAKTLTLLVDDTVDKAVDDVAVAVALARKEWKLRHPRRKRHLCTAGDAGGNNQDASDESPKKRPRIGVAATSAAGASSPVAPTTEASVAKRRGKGGRAASASTEAAAVATVVACVTRLKSSSSSSSDSVSSSSNSSVKGSCFDVSDSDSDWGIDSTHGDSSDSEDVGGGTSRTQALKRNRREVCVPPPSYTNAATGISRALW